MDLFLRPGDILGYHGQTIMALTNPCFSLLTGSDRAMETDGNVMSLFIEAKLTQLCQLFGRRQKLAVCMQSCFPFGLLILKDSWGYTELPDCLLGFCESAYGWWPGPCTVSRFICWSQQGLGWEIRRTALPSAQAEPKVDDNKSKGSVQYCC